MSKQKDLRIYMQLTVYKEGGATEVHSRYRKLAMQHLIGRVVGEKYKIKVLYRGTKFRNEGEYTTKTDLKKALSAFTEKDLIDYIYDNDKD